MVFDFIGDVCLILFVISNPKGEIVGCKIGLYPISQVGAQSEDKGKVNVVNKAKILRNQFVCFQRQQKTKVGYGIEDFLIKISQVKGLPKLTFDRDSLCSACQMEKMKRSSHKSKTESSCQSPLEMLHMDLCGPMRIQSISGKKYILVMVDEYSRYTWLEFLRMKSEAPELIIKFIKRIQVLLQLPVRKIRSDNDTEFKNATLDAYLTSVGISHNFSGAYTLQQNGVVERRNL
ncbi:hypothetical protein OSB04_024355 [Centaurea solstitialis]|uniref:Integrase catalytic domain-containing protein n=1 Tax=Centaurea solstitialis TaxID=347529 RepID=A0AA38SLK7_9ASTR|nr:hypothetical protein OSB04_024355 [Centaurea solstitialis]